MSPAPTYTTLLNSPSSSEEESPNPGKPPSNQTDVGSSLDHGGLKDPTRTHPPMDETKEEKTSEVDYKYGHSLPGNCKWTIFFFLLLPLFFLANVLLHYNATGSKCCHHYYSFSIIILIVPFNIIFNPHVKKYQTIWLHNPCDNNQTNSPPPVCKMGIVVRYKYNSTIKHTIKRSNT